MAVVASGTARIRHADTGAVYEIEAGELDWNEFAADERSMGPEIGYLAEVDHPELGRLAWEFWEYPLGMENDRQVDVGRHALLSNFNLAVGGFDDPDEPNEDEANVERLVEWFRERFEDPAHRTPYESREGGYQWIWGGPYDARDVLENNFSELDEKIIDAAVEEIESEGIHEWAPAPSMDDYDEAYEEEPSLDDLAAIVSDVVQSVPGPQPGPVFRLDAQGRIELAHWLDDARPAPASDAAGSLLQEIRKAADELVEALKGSNGHPEVLAEARGYAEAVADRTPVVSRIYASGVRLDAALSVAEAEVRQELRPELPREAARHLRTLRDLHAAYVMGDEVGRRLVEGAEEYHRRPSEIAQLREATSEFAQAVQEANELFAPSSQAAVAEAAALIEAGPRPERATQVGALTVSNLLKGVGGVLALIGPGLVVELMGQAVGASAPGAALVGSVGSAISAASRFVVAHAPLMQTLAAALGGDLQWLRPLTFALAEIRRRLASNAVRSS